MIENLKIWDAFSDIDPKFTKAITGKAYKGTSPNPQYVIKCLTELFGPVGIGFGWRVLAEEFIPLGPKTLHWCRIEFWHTNRSNTYESYGQTLAAYPTSGGSFMVDEDAPKKSLTDAIIKAASHVGIGASIFLGRWDDQKYVEAVNAEYRAEERSAAKPAAPDQKTMFEADVSAAIKGFARENTLASLGAMFADLYRNSRAVADDPRVIKAKNDRKTALTPVANADLQSDSIPY